MTKLRKDDRQSEVNKALDEDQENFVVEAPDTPPPPPPPPAPAEVQDVEVVDNKANIQEQAIASNETSKEEKVAEVKDIKPSEPVDDIPIDVPLLSLKINRCLKLAKTSLKTDSFSASKKTWINT